MASKKSKPVTTYERLIAFGKIYNVADDEDYKAAALTYAQEAALIAQMREQLSEDGQTVTKEYVKGRENLCVHPLIQEIPKHVDCANRTLAVLGAIIEKRGDRPAKSTDNLSKFRIV